VSPEVPKELERELACLRSELAERRANLPAHSIRPHQMLALEALEEQIAELSRRLKDLA